MKKENPNVKYLNWKWLIECSKLGKIVELTQYLLDVEPENKEKEDIKNENKEEEKEEKSMLKIDNITNLNCTIETLI